MIIALQNQTQFKDMTTFSEVQKTIQTIDICIRFFKIQVWPESFSNMCNIKIWVNNAFESNNEIWMNLYYYYSVLEIGWWYIKLNVKENFKNVD